MALSKATGGRLSASILAGLIVVPAAAIIAVALVTPTAQGEEALPEMTLPEAIGATQAGSDSLEQKVVMEPVTASDEDLEAACGIDGHELVALEQSGEATEIQQAALDALRRLCADIGIPLPEPPAPPPIVKTVIHRASTVASSSSPVTGGHEDHDDEYEDEGHEEHEEHEEHDREDS